MSRIEFRSFRKINIKCVTITQIKVHLILYTHILPLSRPKNIYIYIYIYIYIKCQTPHKN